MLPIINTEYTISAPAIWSGNSVHSHSRVTIVGVVPLITRRGLGNSCSDSSGTLSLQVTLIPAIGNETTLVTESEKLSCTYSNYNCIVMCLNWNLEVFALEERVKPEYPGENLSE